MGCGASKSNTVAPEPAKEDANQAGNEVQEVMGGQIVQSPVKKDEVEEVSASMLVQPFGSPDKDDDEAKKSEVKESDSDHSRPSTRQQSGTFNLEDLPPSKPKEEQPVAPAAPLADVAEYVEVQRVPCSICGRKFAQARIEKHTTACKKRSEKGERPRFDSKSQRLRSGSSRSGGSRGGGAVRLAPLRSASGSLA